jgi:protein gp37
MSGKTKIEWADRTWNPIVGCSVASPGCKNCYALGMAHRNASNPKTPYYAGTTAKNTAGTMHWTGKVNQAPVETLLAPLRWKKPQRIFVNSMSDLFHEDVSDEAIDKVFAVMALCPQHVFMVLTKRSARMREYMTKLDSGGPGRAGDVAHSIIVSTLWDDADSVFSTISVSVQMGLKNVWLGVSVEDQHRAEERIPDLLATPATVRWISAEPLLGPVSLRWLSAFPENAPTTAQNPEGPTNHLDGLRRLEWVVCGGESGHKARPMHPDWARDLRDQCTAADVPFFFKQWGEWKAFYDRDLDDPDWRDVPLCDDGRTRFLNLEGGKGFHGVRVHGMIKVGKKIAGHRLDGKEHLAFPPVSGKTKIEWAAMWAAKHITR